MTNNWQQIKLGEVCTPQKGFTYKSEDYASQDDGQVFITLKCIAKGGGFNTEGIKYIKRSKKTEKLRAGDLIIANTDLTRAGDVIGAPLFVPKLNGENEYVYSMDISKLEVDNSKLDQKYLYQYLLSAQARNYMKAISSGSTVLHLKLKLVDKLSIPLPSITVQHKIGDVLFSIDDSIQKTDQIIRKSEELKKGLMNELLTKGIGHSKFKKTKLGDVPEEWEIRECSEIAEEIIDCKNRTPKYFIDGKHLVVRTPNVRNGRLVLEGGLYTDDSNFREWTKRGIPKPGDILITREAPAGEVCIVPENVSLCLGQRMMYIRPKSNVVESEYLLFYLQSRGLQDHLKIRSTGSTVTHLKVGQIKGLPISVPSLSEQKKILTILKLVDSRIESNTKELASLRQIKKGLMYDIFNQKVQIN